MKYIVVKWLHSNPNEPILIYSEIDEDDWESRKVEIFSDGRSAHADEYREIGGAFLAEDKIPPVSEIAGNVEFEPRVINSEEFEAVWKAATDVSK